VLLVVATACETSNVDPDAEITIGGTATFQDGEPASGSRIALSKEWDLVEGLTTVASLGLACVSDDIDAACGDSELDEADDDGSFAFDLKGSDTQGSFGQASTLEISAEAPAADDELQGPASVQRFRVQTEQLRLPLRLWDAKLTFTADRQRGRATWAPVGKSVRPPGAAASKLAFTLEFRGDRGSTVWRFPAATSPVSVDPRLLEDAAGDVAVFADLDPVTVPKEQGTGVDALFRSARLPYEGRAGVPDSRGKPCFTLEGAKKAERSPCPLTDGDFIETLPAAEEPCPTGCPPTEEEKDVILDLEDTLDIRLVTIRGCSSSCVVATSMDATTWTAFASGRPKGGGSDRLDRPSFFAAPNDNLKLTAPRATKARYVRVTTEDSITRLREVSVFDPVLAAEPEPGRAPVPGERDGGPSSTTRTVLMIVAIALFALALGLLIGSRMRRTR
jgi:hypothetical protein